ncbi:hypothetical protein LTR37_008526 [Vermiconidia calcicola]|uniref:Uncharacterized protein n=1 Tax=Vermiconidia calcicola TaxID=1690605 RepID=A0ACC3NA74_9PEZI|nr:hypothetical protein LTR37_008526 [Vermiconidia calcicola]
MQNDEKADSEDAYWIITTFDYASIHGINDRIAHDRLLIRGPVSIKLFSRWHERKELPLAKAIKTVFGAHLRRVRLGQAERRRDPDALDRLVLLRRQGRGGLCKAYDISVKDCSYFSEYRGTETNGDKRLVPGRRGLGSSPALMPLYRGRSAGPCLSEAADYEKSQRVSSTYRNWPSCAAGRLRIPSSPATFGSDHTWNVGGIGFCTGLDQSEVPVREESLATATDIRRELAFRRCAG